MKINAIQNHWIFVIGAHKEGDFSLLHLFGVVSGRFQPFSACYCLFRIVPLFTSDDTKCFDLQIYYKPTSTKECKCHYKARRFFWITERGKWYSKVGQALTKRGNFITKWGNNYKLVQCRRQRKKTGEIDFGYILLHSPIICLATDTLL